MGGVFCVEDITLERQVALKALNLPPGDGAWSARLLQEARVIAKLEHPGIVPVHDAGTLPDGRPFYTMKLVQGKRLDEHLAAVGNISDRLRVFLRICDPVAFAHAHGVLHRDLKPANVMVGPFGEVLVMDWGLSKLMRAPRGNEEPATTSVIGRVGPTTEHGAVLGTPGFMAPEQTSGSTELDERADIYSLGAMLQSLVAEVHAVPRALAAIIRKAMAHDRRQRYRSVPELAEDVAHFLDGLPVKAYPEADWARAWRWISRNRAWILLLLAYMITRAVLILLRPR